MANSAKVFLFDIDGTILRRAGPAHRMALERASSRWAGRPVTAEGVPVAGMLDRDILRLMLSGAGVGEKRIKVLLPEIVAEAQRLYPRLCPDLKSRIAPGMRAFLERLRRAQIPCGLVTGNLSRIGWHKMTKAGLRAYFRFGAFAEMGRTRSDLVRLALRQAPRHKQAFLVGDHMNDIRAAKENGIPVISVATGPMSREELAAFAPDFLLDTMDDFPLEIIKS